MSDFEDFLNDADGKRYRQKQDAEALSRPVEPLILENTIIGKPFDWMPIDSAPKDGIDIIVGFDVATQWVVHMAFWRGPENSDWQDMVEIGSCTEEDIGWWSYVRGSVSQELLDGYRTPTHWIPMPCLPKEY